MSPAKNGAYLLEINYTLAANIAVMYYPAPQLPADINYQVIFDQLSSVVETVLEVSLYNNINALMNTICTPSGTLIEPARPALVVDEAAWDTYRTANTAFYASLETHRQDIADEIIQVEAALAAIIALIPCNIWIKLSADTVPDGWPEESGAVAAPEYIGWHTNTADADYQPYLLRYSNGSTAPTGSPLLDGTADPAHTTKLTVEYVKFLVPNFDEAAFARVMAGDYSGAA